MSLMAPETNLLQSSDLPMNSRTWHEGRAIWLEQLCQAFFKEDEKQTRVLAHWNTPYAVVFQVKRAGAMWNRRNLELHSKIVAAHEVIELVQVIDQSEADSKLFSSLIEEWHKERRNATWTVDIAMSPSYQKIIAMGKERAVPLILKQLAKEGDEPDHWFWALRILTDANPVPQEHQGDMVRMAEDWIAWGKTSGNAG